MAKNGAKGGGRLGQVTGRSQFHHAGIDRWVKRDTTTGQILNVKHDDKPFKGVRKENEDRS
jgi:hypothetical protein